MFKAQESGLMKRVKAEGGGLRVERALKAEVTRRNISLSPIILGDKLILLGGIQAYRYHKAPVLISYCQRAPGRLP